MSESKSCASTPPIKLQALQEVGLSLADAPKWHADPGISVASGSGSRELLVAEDADSEPESEALQLNDLGPFGRNWRTHPLPEIEQTCLNAIERKFIKSSVKEEHEGNEEAYRVTDATVLADEETVETEAGPMSHIQELLLKRFLRKGHGWTRLDPARDSRAVRERQEFTCDCEVRDLRNTHRAKYQVAFPMAITGARR